MDTSKQANESWFCWNS